MAKDPASGDGWQNRIVGYEQVDPEMLLANPFNWRIHSGQQQDALEGVLDTVGWVDDVIVNQRTGFIVDGHLRVSLALRHGAKSVPVKYVDLSEEEEALILSTLDPIAAMAGTDRDKLNHLLLSIQSEDQRVKDLLAHVGQQATADAAALLSMPLAERFLVPPFSVLDGRAGYWQDRKRAWLALGIQSELGRGRDIVPNGTTRPPEQDGVYRRTGRQAPPMGLLGQSDQVRSGYEEQRAPFKKQRNPQAFGSGRPGDLANEYVHGPLMKSDSGNDPAYYWKKQMVEAALGHPISTEEFQQQYYDGPDAYWSGTSIFDPVLCELIYRWFAPAGGMVLDPFAGGSVRGIVASWLGLGYVGVDLGAMQVKANEIQADHILANRTTVAREHTISDPDALTPIQPISDGRWMKRDDLFEVAGVRGGKVRTCLALAAGAPGLVTAGARMSPQAAIVAAIAQHTGVPARIHTPGGSRSAILQYCEARGAEVVQHNPGYNTVIVARAREDAAASGWTEIPFGMECQEAIHQTRRQAQAIPSGVQRIVVPCGSGMSLAGLLWGLQDVGRPIPVLAVQVGANPKKRLAQYAPPGWESQVTLVKCQGAYHTPAVETVLEGVQLDPIYEAKCIPFLQPGDLLWVVGVRPTMESIRPGDMPRWIVGDSTNLGGLLPKDFEADLIFSCPPYYDLEVYSDDPLDLSRAPTYEAFLQGYQQAIALALTRLRPDRFACFVVGDIRDKAGFYRNFVADTVRAFEEQGAHLYNDAVLVTAIGSLSLRVSKQFQASRKLGKTHQNVLVFYKGDPKAISAFGPVDVADSDGGAAET